MNYCAQCGSARGTSSRYCTQCGQPFEQTASPVAEPTTESTVESTVEVTREQPRVGLPPGPTMPPPSTPPPAPYEWLFTDAGDAEYAEPAAPVAVAPRRERSRSRRPLAIAVGVVVLLAAGAAIGVGLSHHPGPAPASAGTVPSSTAPARSGTASPAPSRTPSAPATHRTTSRAVTTGVLARRVHALLLAEATAHRADNAAVGAVATCHHIAAGRRTVASFQETRIGLLRQLRSLPRSHDPALNDTVARLERIWSGLVPADAAITRWADHASGGHRRCRAGAPPSTSAASKDRRIAFVRSWDRAARGWHTAPVRALDADQLLL